MKGRTGEIIRAQRVDLLITILVLGSLWGFSEVVLGGAMSTAGLPYRAGILTGLGMGIMGIAISTFRKPLMLAGIAFVAILCKQLVVPILHVSVMCEANSCLAVLLEGLALGGVVSLAGRRLDRGYLIKIVSGASAALLAAAAFFFIGMQVAPCRYLLSFNRPGGFMAFLAVEGLVWAAFSAMLFPLGYWTGARLRNVVPVFGTRRPLLYYITSAALVVSSWVASGLAIATGL
jgi:hypothetical protein